MLSALRGLDDSRISFVITSVGLRNAFFAHSENISLAMSSGERPHVSELAWRRINTARVEHRDS